MRFHRYRGDQDYRALTAFLRAVFMANDRREYSWQPYRLDYARWFVMEHISQQRLEDSCFIWETDSGDIAAALTPEGPADAHLHVHPEYRSAPLESEMLDVAEAHLGTARADGSRWLVVWAPDGDEPLRRLLTERGFEYRSAGEHHRHRSLLVPIPEVPPPSGYTVRGLGGADEHPARALVSWRAFHPDDPEDRYEGSGWYRDVQAAPLYRRSLDIVAVAGDGSFAAFATVWFDRFLRTAAFEPVGAHPQHRKGGVVRSVIAEGLRRAARSGATDAYVGSYGQPAHATYASLGFEVYARSEEWGKVLAV